MNTPQNQPKPKKTQNDNSGLAPTNPPNLNEDTNAEHLEHGLERQYAVGVRGISQREEDLERKSRSASGMDDNTTTAVNRTII